MDPGTTSQPPGFEPASGAPVFVGRGRETERLRAGVEALAAGRGSLFLVCGEPGIGKTRLADETAKFAEARAIRVLWGRCWEAGGAPAFWPWVEVLRALASTIEPTRLLKSSGTGASEIARLIPEAGLEVLSAAPQATPRAVLASAEPGAERFRLFDACATLLRAEATPAPLLIILDDIHTADMASLLFLRFVARALRQSRLMIIATYRDSEVRLTPAMADLVSEISREGIVLSLRGIEEPEVGRFVEIAAGDKPTTAMVSALYRITEGNPFFVTEIVRLLIAEGRIDALRFDMPGTFTIPDEVRVAIRRRLDLVSEATRKVLQLASVIGREFDLPLLEKIADVSTENLIHALDEAAAAGIIREAPGAAGRFLFGHALLGETADADLPKLHRQQLHRQIGDSMEELYQSDLDSRLSQIAHHYLKALPWAKPDKAIEYAERAAIRADQIFSHEEAARLYGMALEAMGLQASADQRKRCELLLSLGEAQYRAGIGDESRATFQRASDIARRIENPQCLARAVLGIGVMPTDPTVIDQTRLALIDEALRSVGSHDSSARAMLLACQSWELHWSVDIARRDALSDEAVTIARRLGDPSTLIYVLVHRHLALWGPDNLKERVAMAHEIVALCARSNNHLWAARARYLLIADLFEAGDIAGYDGLIEGFTQLKQAAWLPLAYRERALAVRALMDGRFADGEALAEQAQAMGQQLRRRARNAFFFFQYALRRAEGRFAEVEPTLKKMIGRMPSSLATLMLYRSWLAAGYAENGAIAEATSEFQALPQQDFSALRRDETWLVIMVMLGVVCRAIGDKRRAAIVYQQLLPVKDHHAVLELNACLGPVSHYLGILAAALDREDDAIRHFDEALAFSRRMNARTYLAPTLHEYAALLLDGKATSAERERGLMLAREALQIARAIGMHVVEAKARALIDGALTAVSPAPGADKPGDDLAKPAAARNLFRREGEYWTIAYGGAVFRLKDVKGLGYLAHLLRYPAQDFHVLDLSGLGGGEAAESGESEDADAGDAAASNLEIRRGPSVDAGEVIDQQAREAYRARLLELREEIEEARELGNVDRAEALQEEVDQIARHYSAGVGLGGRPRRAASSSERARINVGRAIRSTIDRIGEQCPALGEMLTKAIKTGTYCSYAPAENETIDWDF
jgi:tetratricopeptide (TPR) repeat protein